MEIALALRRRRLLARQFGQEAMHAGEVALTTDLQWTQLLIPLLKLSDTITVTHQQVAGHGCDAARLVQQRVLELIPSTPDLYRATAQSVFSALREPNGLEPLETYLRPPVVGVGMLRRSGRRVPVVWIREPGELFYKLIGLQHVLGTTSLIVLVARAAGGSMAPSDPAVTVVELPDSGDLGLERASRVRLSSRAPSAGVNDSNADITGVRLVFSTVPGSHHVLLINEVPYRGMRSRHSTFLRLLLLAAHRKYDLARGGWVNRQHLHEDDLHVTVNLRKELSQFDHPTVSRDDRAALVKTRRQMGLVRLAVPPENIGLDLTLEDLQWTMIGASAECTEQVTKGYMRVAKLLERIEQLRVLPEKRCAG
jgi:hypothetical protein